MPEGLGVEMWPHLRTQSQTPTHLFPGHEQLGLFSESKAYIMS